MLKFCQRIQRRDRLDGAWWLLLIQATRPETGTLRRLWYHRLWTYCQLRPGPWPLQARWLVVKKSTVEKKKKLVNFRTWFTTYYWNRLSKGLLLLSCFTSFLYKILRYEILPWKFTCQVCPICGHHICYRTVYTVRSLKLFLSTRRMNFWTRSFALILDHYLSVTIVTPSFMMSYS